MAQHRRGADWWLDVATIRIEKHPTRGLALDAERRAVASERPLYNVRLQGRQP